MTPTVSNAILKRMRQRREIPYDLEMEEAAQDLNKVEMSIPPLMYVAGIAFVLALIGAFL